MPMSNRFLAHCGPQISRDGFVPEFGWAKKSLWLEKDYSVDSEKDGVLVDQDA
jgi:hypothetical protein